MAWGRGWVRVEGGGGITERMLGSQLCNNHAVTRFFLLLVVGHLTALKNGDGYRRCPR